MTFGSWPPYLKMLHTYFGINNQFCFFKFYYYFGILDDVDKNNLSIFLWLED
jgi:hypothetical protein